MTAQRLWTGALAGAAATVVMSGVIWGSKRAGVYRNTPAPEVISHGIRQQAGQPQPASEPGRKTLVAVEHLGFGSVSGALFGLATLLLPATVLTGTVFGVLLWLVSYAGWLPVARLLPPPAADEPGRAATMVTAHVVYGAVLGFTARRLQTWTGSERR